MPSQSAVTPEWHGKVEGAKGILYQNVQCPLKQIKLERKVHQGTWYQDKITAK